MLLVPELQTGEGRRKEGHFHSGRVTSCVVHFARVNQLDPELLLSFLHGEVHGIFSAVLSESKLTLAFVFPWKIFSQLCKVDELFAYFPE